MTPAFQNSARSPLRPALRTNSREVLLPKVAMGLMAAAVLGLLFALFGFEALPFKVERAYLIPWVLATGVVIFAPLYYLKRRGEFHVAHPLVYAAGTYFFPMFFLGGWSLVFGLSSYYYLAFVNDPEYDFPLAFFYIIVGFACLSIGFLLPPGRRVGSRIGKWLPSGDLNISELIIGSMVTLIAGFYATVVALELGQIGYQSAGVVYGDVGSLNAYLTIVVPTSSVLLWLAFFQIQEWSVGKYVILAAQVFAAAFMLVALGGKSSLIQSVLYMVGAFVLVRRKVVFRNWAWVSLGLGVALVVGFIYGTTFRSLKETDERISADKYVEVAFDTVSKIGEGGGVDELGLAFYQFAERLEIASSLAVVVSNYEALRTYEAGYGLENNIWQYTWTAFVPRFFWKDKPTIADNFSYNELYFGYGGFGLAITAMGDLLRNFGPVGVPIGMFVLGFFIRIFYSALVEGQPFSAWRSALYFIVVTKISYDSFYGEILPTVIRVGAVVIIQFLFIKVLSRLFFARRS